MPRWKWYNAGYRTPRHSYNPDNLEVVEVKLVVFAKIEGRGYMAMTF